MTTSETPEKNDTDPKMVIVCREDLKMRKGKVGAQCAHAAMQFALESWLNGIPPTPVEAEWLKHRLNGVPQKEKKIVLRADSEEELHEVARKAKEAGLKTHVILDSGLTEFDGPMYTAVGIGPDWPEKINPITGHLKPL